MVGHALRIRGRIEYGCAQPRNQRALERSANGRVVFKPASSCLRGKEAIGDDAIDELLERLRVCCESPLLEFIGVTNALEQFARGDRDSSARRNDGRALRGRRNLHAGAHDVRCGGVDEPRQRAKPDGRITRRLTLRTGAGTMTDDRSHQ